MAFSNILLQGPVSQLTLNSVVCVLEPGPALPKPRPNQLSSGWEMCMLRACLVRAGEWGGCLGVRREWCWGGERYSEGEVLGLVLAKWVLDSGGTQWTLLSVNPGCRRPGAAPQGFQGRPWRGLAGALLTHPCHWDAYKLVLCRWSKSQLTKKRH